MEKIFFWLAVAYLCGGQPVGLTTVDGEALLGQISSNGLDLQFHFQFWTHFSTKLICAVFVNI